MASPNDMLKQTPAEAAAVAPKPPPPAGDKATAAWWSQATGRWPYFSALRAAGKTAEDLMTEAEFVAMVDGHGARVISADGTELDPKREHRTKEVKKK